jgi:hypothetical protein
MKISSQVERRTRFDEVISHCIEEESAKSSLLNLNLPLFLILLIGKFNYCRFTLFWNNLIKITNLLKGLIQDI